MTEKVIIDIEDVNEEFDRFLSRLRLLSDRFLAVAMDYKHYIDSSFEENKIYELRDNVQYRFYSAKFHVEILLNHQLSTIKQLEEISKSDIKTLIENFQNPALQITFQRQISALFDSFIYHTASIFDYISTLINYISGEKKEDTLMWSQLTRSVRDKNNGLSKKSFAEKITQIDNVFVDKLYEHRAFIIHRKADIISYEIKLILGKEARIQPKLLAGKNLIRSFSELKKLNKENDLTVNYVTFWILNKSIDKVTDILFLLKSEMETNRKTTEPLFFYHDSKTNSPKPISINYWHEDEYKKNN